MKTGAIFFIGILGVFLACFRVDATAATSNIMISQLQTGGAISGTASHEYIEIANNTDEDIDVTDWCITYASSTNTGIGSDLACFRTASSSQRLYLLARGSVRLGSSEFTAANPSLVIDATFRGTLSGTGGHVNVVDSDRTIIDRIGWGTAQYPEGTVAIAPPGGQVLQRKSTGSSYQDTQNNQVDFVLAALSESASAGLYEAVDVCLNQTVFPGLQESVPEGYEVDQFGMCQPIPEPPECTGVVISEILPNPSGVDTGYEYIELYNTTAEAVVMEPCQLFVDETSYVFTETIAAYSYLLVRSMNLPNSNGAVVRLITTDTEEAVTYPPDLADNETWALLPGGWQVTNQKSPAAANVPYIATIETSGTSDVLAACPAGKYRNPETNRCRSLNTTSVGLRPCAADQVRNPETNRCRKIASIAGALTPCGPGQQRNPETNRCRKVTTATSLLKPCDEGEERNPETNRCRKIAGVAGVASAAQADTTQVRQNYRVVLLALMLAAGYGLYEYRQELRTGFSKLTTKVLRR